MFNVSCVSAIRSLKMQFEGSGDDILIPIADLFHRAAICTGRVAARWKESARAPVDV